MEWKLNLYMLLTMCGYKYVLTKSCPKVFNSESEEARKEWIHCNDMAMILMMTSMTLEMRSQFSYATIASELIQALDQAYRKPNLSIGNEAFDRFMSKKIRDCANSFDSRIVMMEHINEAEIHGVRMDEIDPALRALMSLPELFNIYKGNNLNDDKEIIWSRLIMEVATMELLLFVKNTDLLKFILGN